MNARPLDETLSTPGGPDLQGALEAAVAELDVTHCTLHVVSPGSETLELRASVGLPQRVLDTVRVVPFGKGMAGICAIRRTPVTVCNLQTDESGVVRPGAKETGVQGAIVVPILRDDAVVATFGVGKTVDHDYDETERARIAEIGDRIVRALGR